MLFRSVLGEYSVQNFPTASVPSQAQWEDALSWTREKGLVEGDVSYQDSVNSNLLP